MTDVIPKFWSGDLGQRLWMTLKVEEMKMQVQLAGEARQSQA